tara:strand:- start:864 stop:1295 length:432 start_codon:yes stop_codon:yes gene_type:complete
MGILFINLKTGFLKALIIVTVLLELSGIAQAKSCQNFVWKITAVLEEGKYSKAFIEGNFDVTICDQDVSYLQDELGEKLYVFRCYEGLESRTGHIDYYKNIMLSTVFNYDVENQKLNIIREKHDLKKLKLVDTYTCNAILEVL